MGYIELLLVESLYDNVQLLAIAPAHTVHVGDIVQLGNCTFGKVTRAAWIGDHNDESLSIMRSYTTILEVTELYVRRDIT